jgi:sulfur dioxygenase
LQANESAIDDNSVRFPTLAQLAQVKQMAPKDLRERVLAGTDPILLDVREPEEFVGELGHIAGASLIRLQHLSDRSKELEQFKHSEIVAICRAGVRSTTAAAMLTGLGFEQVSNLRGGMLDWVDANFPVEHGSLKTYPLPSIRQLDTATSIKVSPQLSLPKT